MVNNLNIFQVLRAFSIVARHSSNKGGLFLIELDIKGKRVSSTYFKTSLLPEAIETYRKREQEVSTDTNKDVVLVSAKSLTQLKKAYPNYFADTRLFLKILSKNLTNK